VADGHEAIVIHTVVDETAIARLKHMEGYHHPRKGHHVRDRKESDLDDCGLRRHARLDYR
jgi:hypothetical protein